MFIAIEQSDEGDEATDENAKWEEPPLMREVATETLV